MRIFYSAYSYIALFSILLIGCSSFRATKKLSGLQIGMSKQELVEKLGKPDARRNYNEKESGEVVEIYEYKMVPTETSAVPFARTASAIITFGISSLADNPSSNYVVGVLCILKDGKLVEWRMADD